MAAGLLGLCGLALACSNEAGTPCSEACPRTDGDGTPERRDSGAGGIEGGASHRSWTLAWDSGGTEFARQVAVTATGEAYVAGYTDGGFSGAVSGGAWDAFIGKASPQGERLWERQWGTAAPEFAQSVATDAAGNVFVTGYTYGALSGQRSEGKYDAFLIKLDADGEVAWSRQWGTEAHEYVYAMAVHPTGTAFVVGYTEGDLDQSNAGEADAFLRAYDPTGAVLFTRQWGTELTDYAQAVAVDALGNVFVSGYTQGDLDGNVSLGSEDAFLTRFDASGEKLWTRQWGSATTDYGLSLAADGAGGVYVTGYTYGAVEAGAEQGLQDAFLSKFTDEGALLWNRQWGGRLDDNARGLTLDGGERLLVTGDTQGSLDGNSSGGGRDRFVTAFDLEGEKQWTLQWGGPDQEFGLGIGSDRAGSIWVAGYAERARMEGESGLERDATLTRLERLE